MLKLTFFLPAIFFLNLSIKAQGRYHTSLCGYQGNIDKKALDSLLDNGCGKIKLQLSQKNSSGPVSIQEFTFTFVPLNPGMEAQNHVKCFSHLIGNKLDPGIIELIKQAQSGDMMFFTDIVITEGNEKQEEKKGFSLRVK